MLAAVSRSRLARAFSKSQRSQETTSGLRRRVLPDKNRLGSPRLRLRAYMVWLRVFRAASGVLSGQRYSRSCSRLTPLAPAAATTLSRAIGFRWVLTDAIPLRFLSFQGSS